MHVDGTRLPAAEELHVLAAVVASALDADDTTRAWAITRALETAAGISDDAAEPPAPVVGRRFARAHRRLLERGMVTAASTHDEARVVRVDLSHGAHRHLSPVARRPSHLAG